MSKENNNFLLFFRGNKWLILYTFFLTISIYGIKIVNINYGMDTLGLMKNFDQTMTHWVMIGRPGMLIFKKLLFGTYTNVYFLNLIGILFLALMSIFICYLGFIVLENSFSRTKIYIIPSLLVTSPLWPHQYYFVLQNAEFSICMTLIVISILLTYTSSNLCTVRNLFAVFLASFAFSVYQSFAIFYISLTCFTILMYVYKCQKTNDAYFVRVGLTKLLQYIFVFFLASIAYIIFKKLALVHYDLKESHYLSNLTLWGRLPVSSVYRSITGVLQKVVFPSNESTPYNYLFIISFLFICSIWVCFFLKKVPGKFLFILCGLVLNFSALVMIFVYGTSPAYRSMVPSYCFVCAANIFLCSLYTNKKSFMVGLTLFVALYTFKQANTTSNLLISDQVRFDEDNRKVEAINNQLNNLGLKDSQNYKLMLTGFSPSRSNLSLPEGMVGKSMFQFGDFTGDSYAVSQNIVSLMRTRGIIYQDMSHEEYSKLLPRSSNMHAFPEKGDIKIVGKVIIIKLS